MIRLAIRAIAVGWIIAWWLWLIGFQHNFVEVDGQAYWGLDLDSLYRGVQLGDQDAFLYSPPVALLMLPLSWLPYDVFYALFAVLNLSALVDLLGWELAAIGLFVLPISNEIARANIHLLLALAIVVGFRHPAAWAWVLLTKVTPGVGLLWFAFRREWAALATALTATAVVSVVTVILVPDLWARWFELLVGSAGMVRPNAVTSIPVVPRLVIAVAVVALAAWRRAPALVPVASLIALPAIWVNSLAMLVAVVPLLRRPPVADAPDEMPIEDPDPSPRLAGDAPE